MKSTEYEEHRMQVTLTVKRLLDCPLDGRSLYVKLKWGSRALWGGKENYTSTKPSQKRTIEWEETFDHECTVFLDTVVLGLKWKDAGSQKPANGIEIRNADLASALQSKLTFTKQELKSFGVPAVTFDSHIKVGDKYFKPAEVAKEEGHLRRQQTSLAHLRLSVRKEKNGQNPIKARKRKLGNIDIPLVDWAVLYGNGKEHNVRYLLDGTYSTALLEVAVKIKWPDGEPLRQDGALYHSISGGVFEDSKEESHPNTPLPKLEMGNSNPGKEEQDEEEKLASDVWREYSHFQNYSADDGADASCQDPVQEVMAASRLSMQETASMIDSLVQDVLGIEEREWTILGYRARETSQEAGNDIAQGQNAQRQSVTSSGWHLPPGEAFVHMLPGGTDPGKSCARCGGAEGSCNCVSHASRAHAPSLKRRGLRIVRAVSPILEDVSVA